MALLKRLAELDRPQVDFVLDGQPAIALQGDTLLTALLCSVDALKGSDFSAEPRAGFCLMGACQDCWVRLEDGRRVRACSTLIEPGMQVTREPGRQP
ncbi:(2Fe-2S)-binding protein [Pseudomonas matsuisoli]|uniref:Ferredoxin n=1 Tax=Pseudomonas matsuisoli TaxID=1515666 RepID=A0A917Q116_9PSED|nr:(2Fe-2S)-binding protein [Pseudomonas matsuisoli]GGK04739.1 ferredoxin [Pseudomonas matsuisoli]